MQRKILSRDEMLDALQNIAFTALESAAKHNLDPEHVFSMQTAERISARLSPGDLAGESMAGVVVGLCNAIKTFVDSPQRLQLDDVSKERT
jgi:hypothetical protein